MVRAAGPIEWFDRWVRTRDQRIKQRILEYNEDDCRATRVLLDGIRGLALEDAWENSVAALVFYLGLYL